MAEIILSVGIDIGTSTTQLVFSHLTIENTSSAFRVPRISIIDKKVVYKSNIIMTPIIGCTTIEQHKIQQFVTEEYEKAKINKEDIQTGAVIITGETARKENAEEVLQALSGFAGDFVVATAGPDLESIIAGKGAGIHTFSKEHSATIVNIDIGGGTSNLVVFDRGEVIDTGCLDIGGRLIRVNRKTMEIEYIAPKIKKMIAHNNFDIAIGQVTSALKLQPVVDKMVELLEESVGIKPLSACFHEIITNKGIKLDHSLSHISFTGGVADAIYHRSDSDIFKYGDIGLLLGKTIANSTIGKSLTIVKPVETIRATVVGAGSHTTEISGSTITYTENIFPLKNIPVIHLGEMQDVSDIKQIDLIIKEKLKWFEMDDSKQVVALSFEGNINASFKEVHLLADGIIQGMNEYIHLNIPLIIITKHDMAKVLGQTLFSKIGMKKDVVCIDSVNVADGDYIDIGHPVADGAVLPVVIKTLVFH